MKHSIKFDIMKYENFKQAERIVNKLNIAQHYLDCLNGGGIIVEITYTHSTSSIKISEENYGNKYKNESDRFIKEIKNALKNEIKDLLIQLEQT